MDRRVKEDGLQISENLFLCTPNPGDISDGDFVNHSCEPNAGIRGQILLVAMCDIKKGEEITFDYAMAECCHGFRMKCVCGKRRRRKFISYEDWKIPRLQKLYKGYFPEYLQQKINLLRKK